MSGRLMLVGRDYGFHEHIAKRPFVGPAGSLLNRGLKAAGINRDECVVTNVVSKKPPHDEWKLHSAAEDRKSTRLNSSHRTISYAVFCLKKKKKKTTDQQ